MSSDASERSAQLAAVLQLGAEVSAHALAAKLTPLLATPLTVQQLRCHHAAG